MNRKIRVLTAVFCLAAVLCSIPALGATLKELKRRAKKGDASSQYELGRRDCTMNCVREKYTGG